VYFGLSNSKMDKENEAITKRARNPISYWDSIAF
jgi:hypothetical protein